MAYKLVMFFILKVNVVIDNHCLLIKCLEMELSLKTLANWPRSLKELDTIPLSL